MITTPENAKGKHFVLFDRELSSGNFLLDECRNNPQCVCLRIVRRQLHGGGEYLHVEQIDRPEGAVAFGGNFVYSGDSRFAQPFVRPLPVHDHKI